MCKKALCIFIVLLSGVWAQAQQSQPGYAVLNSNQGAARPTNAIPTSLPPEPGAMGGPAEGNPTGGAPGMGYPPGYGMGYPPGYGMGYPPGPAMGLVGGPGPVPGYGVPAGGPVPDPYGPVPGPYGPGPGVEVPPDALSTFGTEQFWFDLAYVAGWLQRPGLAASAPLVTRGSVNDLHPGALGQPGTTVAYGPDQYKFGTYSGLQGAFGVNLNDRIYLELNALFLPMQHNTSVIASDAGGNPLIARPVFNTAVNEERSYLTSTPGNLVGSTRVDARSQVWGIEAAARYNVAITPYLTGDFLIGYRHLELIESLMIQDTLIPIQQSVTFRGAQVLSPNSIQDFDRFATNNAFNGVDFGGRFRWQSGYDWFAIMGYSKLAIGGTTQTVNVSGNTTLVTPAGNVVAPGGILAQPSNIGNYSRTVFGAIPEGGFAFILIPHKYVRFQVGYSATYWNSVVRPGNQIDHRVSPAQVPTDLNYVGPTAGAFPAFKFNSQGMVIQTLNVGLQFYY